MTKEGALMDALVDHTVLNGFSGLGLLIISHYNFIFDNFPLQCRVYTIQVCVVHWSKVLIILLRLFVTVFFY